MSKINKLQITGVRSFDNKKGETIEFHTPLTLIVGLNGSGKTTIIECLRYATTGELPPNSAQSGAWIHDPKLCGEREVMAQVKLGFVSASGAKMVATRSLQLTVKKTMRSQKTLEAQLLMVKGGERTSISSRTAELDQIMPQYMGVSKAILENVIFCHQDDSLWPMSQPAVLKKKFDEIFEAQKYTKCIDNIKVLRKKHKEELDKFKIMRDHARQIKDKGAKAEKESLALSEEIERLKEENADLDEKLQRAASKAQEAWDHAARFDTIVNSLNSKRIMKDEKEKSVANLRQHMNEMTDSDEELQQLQERYEERAEQSRQEGEKLRKKYSKLAQELNQQRSALGQKQSEVGKFEGQQATFENQLEKRQDIIRSAANAHNIRGFDGDITEAHVVEFMTRLNKAVRDANATAERDRRHHNEEVKQAQDEVNHYKEQRASHQQTKESSKGQIANNDKRISLLQTTIDAIKVDEGGRVVLESTIQDTERKLTLNKQQYDGAKWEDQIGAQEAAARVLDEKKERLDSEIIQATKQAGDSARLDFVRKELKNRRQMLETNLGAHRQRITAVLGEDWQPSTVESRFQSILKDKQTAVKDAELQRDGLSRELEQVNYKLSTMIKDVTQRQKDLKDCEQKVRAAIEDEPAEYEMQLREAEQRVSELKLGNHGNEAMKGWYQQALDVLSGNDCCRLCRRGMRNERERRDLKTFIEKALKNATDQEAEQDAASAEQWLEDVRAVRPFYDTVIRLQAELPPLETEIKSLEKKRDSVNIRLEAHDQAVKDREGARKEVDILAKTVQAVSKYQTEIDDFEKDVKDLEATQMTAGQSRGLEPIQEDLKKMNEQSRNFASTINQLRNERERARSQITASELEVRDLQAKLSTATHQLREKFNLENQIQDLKSQNQSCRDSISTADRQVEALAPMIAQAEAKHNDVHARGEELLREVQSGLNKLGDSQRQLKLIEQDITAYIDGGGKDQLARAKREMQNLEDQIVSVETEQRQVTIDVKQIEDQSRNHSDTKRTIQDNLLYRQNRRQLQRLTAEISELEEHNAEADKERYELEAHRWQTERNRLATDQATFLGSIRAKDDQLGKLLQDWNTEYKDAAYKYKESHIKVETTAAAVEDLGRYGNALDQAIMKYHGIKMSEINSIIEELWRKTYQGTDIDKICIKSENETQKGNKSYNYRVVMYKQDAEMDMRGRCSAGQKVLASIIIRLALAECFGINCGLIALDEPTTNLDRDNIRALAEALAEIIRLRRQQTNFQIIIITHDEEFLRQMNCGDFCDYYYRVSRSEKQTSVIRRQNVSEVM